MEIRVLISDCVLLLKMSRWMYTLYKNDSIIQNLIKYLVKYVYSTYQRI
jgi:hypothetical protein